MCSSVWKNGFFVDNGTNTTAAQPEGWAFQREAVLGIRNTDWGTFSFGRQYTLNFGGIAQFDAFCLQFRQHDQQLYGAGALLAE